MKFNRQSYLSTRRDAWVEINLDAIEKNILELKKFCPKNSEILAVVKADAYGHGSIAISPVMIASGVKMLGVSSIDEAMQIREAKNNTPILILGASPLWCFDWAAKNKINLSLFSDEHIEAAKQTFLKTGLKTLAHIKLDTGMNRIGVKEEKAVDFIKKVQNSEYIQLNGIFTHFACGENRSKTLEQINIFEKIISQVNTDNLLLHLGNTVGAISYPELSKYNMVRFGIGIYGLHPDYPEDLKNKPNLIPALSLKGRITNIHTMKKNEGISYSHRYIAKNDIKVATIPIGYADGIFRGLSGKIYGILHGKKVKQIGSITMDQMMFDITGIDADFGDVITLIGSDEKETISIDEWAKILNTINYELTCSLRVRLPRVYTR